MAFKSRRRDLGKAPSEGTRQLRIIKVRRQLSLNAIARALSTEEQRCTTSNVTRWLFGDCAPERAWARRISEVFGIAPDLWDLAPRRPIEVAHAA